MPDFNEPIKNIVADQYPVDEEQRRAEVRAALDTLRQEVAPVSRGVGASLVKAQIEGEDIFQFRQEAAKNTHTMGMEILVGQFGFDAVMDTAKYITECTLQILSKELEAVKRPDVTDDGMGTVESNFGLYVDGWTLTGTNTVGEIFCKHLDGREVMVPSRSLVAFLDRRVDV